jgi:N-acetylglutamate synthase-like GNAT family acetyltransferase
MSRTADNASRINLRQATNADMDAINKVIERAVQTWRLPERVKRLAMSSYLYNEHDLRHLHIVLAEDSTAGVIGVAAWETAAERDCPKGRRGLLLHGLYVDPDRRHRGTGTRLLSAAAEAAREQDYDGLLVKAQADAEGFFRSQGLQQLAVEDAERDYPHRFWLDRATQKRMKDA